MMLRTFLICLMLMEMKLLIERSLCHFSPLSLKYYAKKTLKSMWRKKMISLIDLIIHHFNHIEGIIMEKQSQEIRIFIHLLIAFLECYEITCIKFYQRFLQNIINGRKRDNSSIFMQLERCPGQAIVWLVRIDGILLELRQNRKMQKFKQIQAHSFQKYIVNVPKILRQSQPAIHQPAKVESMRNLRSTPIASSSFLGINPKSRVRLSTQCQDTTVHKCKDNKHLKAVKRPFQMVQRFRTEDKESIYLKNMETLKKYVNNLTLKCGNLRKEEDIGKDSDNDAEAAKERKRFLMGQISFTQIDEERVMAQKKYLERFQYLSKSVPRVIRGGSPQGDSNNESRIFQCLRCIDRIYRLLREMEEAGYSLKNNRHVIDYCINGRLWLKRVFLHQSGEKKDAFKIAIKYLVNANCEETKTHFGEFAVKTRGEELRVVQDELVGLYQHLEHSMAQKKIMQVVNVANYIEGRLLQEGKILSRSLRCTQAPQDKMKLTKDLEGIEEKFGPMRNITRISRKRYDELNRTYDKLQTHG